MKQSFYQYSVMALLASLQFTWISCAEDDNNESPAKQLITLSVDVNNNAMLTTRGDNTTSSITYKTFEGAKSPVYGKMVSINQIDQHKGMTPLESLPEDTRGRSVSTAEFYDSYGLIVFEYNNTQTWAANGSTMTSEVYNEEVTRSRAWMTNEFWPGSGKRLAFFAYAPYNAAGVTITNSSSIVTGTPQLHYTVPTAIASQNDLLICANEKDVPGDYNLIKQITFDHVCTAVRIAIGSQMAACKITNITLQGVYGEADYTFGAASWTNHSNTKNFSLSQEFVIEEGESNRILTNSDNIFMMIPQTVPSDAKLVVTVNDGSSHTLETSIGGDLWKMGSTVTYYLSTSGTGSTYILGVTKPSSDFTPDGGSGYYYVNSYKMTYFGSSVPVPWEASYSFDDDPTWYNALGDTIREFTFSGAGSTGNPYYTIQIKAQDAYPDPTTNTHTATLRSRSVVTGPYDLSQGGPTANCYVVSAPGTYKVPLVYGNARNNPASYNSATFVDHTGTHIQGPNIYDYYTPYDATLVWQDAPFLIREETVKLTSDGHYIQFTIDQNDITQGNAVIAVRDNGGVIMWSWHIWVTDYDVSTDKAIAMQNDGTGGYVTSHFMPKAVGECDYEKRIYPERIIHLKVKQMETDGDSAVVNIKQSTGTFEIFGNATLYQAGRKDPMPGELGDRSGGKPSFGPYKFHGLNTLQTLAEAIQNPHVAFNNIHWLENKTPYVRNLWNVTNDTIGVHGKPVVKSIYDPSPAGYCMPRNNAFTGFDKNKTGSWTENGWNIYSHGPLTGTPVYWRSFGEKSPNGTTQYYSKDWGWYWTAGPWTDSYWNAIIMYPSGMITPTSDHTQAGYGIAVRPVVED